MCRLRVLDSWAMAMSTPAGWYPEPSSGAGAMRWWDGERWTEHVSVPTLPPPPVPGPTPLERETAIGRTARIAAIATGVAMPIQLFLSAFVLAELVGFFDDVVSDRVRVDESTFRINPAVSMASNITSLVVFVAFVVTVVWVHVSATTAQRLGIPARRSPGWAVGGFLIPVVNLWWPYQSVCDLFTPGDPDRRVVGRWWALYLGASFTPMIAVGLAFVWFPAAVAVGVLSAGLYLGAAFTLRRLITMAADAHTRLVEGGRA